MTTHCSSIRLIVAIPIVFSALALSSGCQTVKPWEKATLGTYLMRSDRDPLEGKFAEHIYFTREASSGGTGVGGGGCGCN